MCITGAIDGDTAELLPDLTYIVLSTMILVRSDRLLAQVNSMLRADFNLWPLVASEVELGGLVWTSFWSSTQVAAFAHLEIRAECVQQFCRASSLRSN